MNALNMSNLRIVACGAVAVALTMVLSWGFVESTSVARWVTPEAPARVVSLALDRRSGELLRAGAAVLLD